MINNFNDYFLFNHKNPILCNCIVSNVKSEVFAKIDSLILIFYLFGRFEQT